MILTPNAITMARHLSALFGDSKDGLIEIAYTPSDTGAVNQAEFFSVAEIDKAAEFAAQINAQEGVNVYVGAALRNPDTAPFMRSSSDDFMAATAAWVDLDDPDAAKNAKEKYSKLPPSFVVVTGRIPHMRAQAWWRLKEPQANKSALKAGLSALLSALDGDKAVADPIRVMRLAGSISWPKKAGRVPEITEFVIPDQASQAVSFDDINSHFPADESVPQQAHRREVGLNLTHQSLRTLTRKPVEDVRAMLGHIDPDIPYQDWINVGMALHNEGYPFSVWDDWSRGGAKYDPKIMGAHWKSFHAGGGVTFGTVYKMARDNGYQTRVDNFIASRQPEQASEISPFRHEISGEAPIDDFVGQPQKQNSLYYIKDRDIKPALDCNDFVQGLLADGALSVVYGPSNCGKTFFMTDLAFHIAAGKEWRGRRVEQGGVIYVALEGSYGLKNRVAAYKKERGDIGNKFAVVPCAVDFFNPDANLADFLELLDMAKTDIGPIKIIVVDTLARALAGGDENSGQDMGLLVKHADIIRATTGAHVCFIHHSGKDEARGARGHSSLRAAVDTEIEVTRNQSEDFSRVKVVKQREMDMGPEMQFRLEVVRLGQNKYGEDVTSCVVTPTDAAPKAKLKPGSREAVAYEIIRDLISEQGFEVTGPEYPDGIRVVTRRQIEGRLTFRGLAPEASCRQATHRIIANLIEKKLAVQVGSNVWLSA